MTKNYYSIAIDAMGGESAPDKVIEGISLFLKNNNNFNFNIYGDEDQISESLKKFKIFSSPCCKIFHCPFKIEDKNSVRDAIRIGKDTSMWRAIESVKK